MHFFFSLVKHFLKYLFTDLALLIVPLTQLVEDVKPKTFSLLTKQGTTSNKLYSGKHRFLYHLLSYLEL